MVCSFNTELRGHRCVIRTLGPRFGPACVLRVRQWIENSSSCPGGAQVEREDRGAAELGPRMSLVFKRRVQEPAVGEPERDDQAADKEAGNA